MSNSGATMKKIAELAGVSITTVHRVLNNKEGCSEQLREKIYRIAQEQGYSVNYAAASVSKHTLNIVLLFPANGWGHNFFLQPMLNGYLAYRRDVSKFNVVFQEQYFGSNEGEDSPAKLLRDLYLKRPVECDGIVMYDIDPTPEVHDWVNRLLGQGKPIVMLEKEHFSGDGICTVTPNEEIAGRMAGELMSKFLHKEGTVAVLSQQLKDVDGNPSFFTEELTTRRKGLKIEQFGFAMDGSYGEQIRNILSGIDDLAGVYITSARHTAGYLSVCDQLPVKPETVIGSELFAETKMALDQGKLDAVIDKRPFSIGYHALDILFSHLVKNEPLISCLRITPRAIFQSNSAAYYDRNTPN